MTTTATDLTLILADRVGSLAEAIDVLQRAGVNIRGHGGFLAWAGEGVLHLIVDDVERAMVALRDTGIEVREERVVVVVPLDDRPGTLAEVLTAVAAVGVNVDLTYSCADGSVVLGVNDVARVRRALGAGGEQQR